MRGCSDREQIDQLRVELRFKNRELQDLRDQLRAIQTSDGWAMLRTLGQVREALAPYGTRRDRLARQGVRGLRLLKKGVVRLAQSLRTPWPTRVRRNDRRIRIEPIVRENYTVVCLPIIEWGFRFQRPQQLMRQFALKGHLVLYAANHFHHGVGARTRLVETNLLELTLPGDPAANVYQMLPSEADLSRMVEALAHLRIEMGVADAVVIAQHPYWTALSELLRQRFGWSIVYDCMDDHAGFLHNGAEILQTEGRLIVDADLVIASSAVLFEGIRHRARASLLLRNACEYEHFSKVASVPPVRRDSPRIGYYGAIAEWFDSRLVAELARLRHDWRFELIGSTLAGDVRRLKDADNIRLLGEQAYGELPHLIIGWDIFIIPFKRVPLTEATNPVKVYEMLATGKPVVAVPLPELVPIEQDGLIRLAETVEEFARLIEEELGNESASIAERRRAFARDNTWQARQEVLAIAIDEILGGRDATRRDDVNALGGIDAAARLAG